MNYEKIYNNLIQRAKLCIRKPYEYYEKHHIIPRCIGGSDIKSNIVFLSAREHFIAHQLLIKIFPDNKSLVHAARMMCVKSKNHKINRSQNRLYEWLRVRHKKIMKSKTGDKNHQYRTIWIHNKDLLINTKIKKYKIELYLCQGWIIGRVFNWKKYNFIFQIKHDVLVPKIKKIKIKHQQVKKIRMYNVFGQCFNISLLLVNEYINQNWSIAKQNVKIQFCNYCATMLKKDQQKYCSIQCYNIHHNRKPKIQKIKKHTYQQGNRNSQYGKRFVWMYNEVGKNAKINHSDVDHFLQLGWKKGKVHKSKILPCRVL